jgi:hypothetical protein
MKLKTLAGHEIEVKISPGKNRERTLDQCKSKLQFEAGARLREFFPGQIILEEFKIPKERLFLDYFIPNRKVALEVQGAQHFKFNPFFHKNVKDFQKSQERDRKKVRWCQINDIKLIIVREPSEVISGIIAATGE